jgi:hypothetical protein
VKLSEGMKVRLAGARNAEGKGAKGKAK